MENMSMYFKIYELKGLIESMSEMAEHNNEFDNPLIDKAQTKMKEIIEEIEEKHV